MKEKGFGSSYSNNLFSACKRVSTVNTMIPTERYLLHITIVLLITKSSKITMVTRVKLFMGLFKHVYQVRIHLASLMEVQECLQARPR